MATLDEQLAQAHEAMGAPARPGHRRLFTDDQVRLIRCLAEDGYNESQIAKYMAGLIGEKVFRSSVSQILEGRSYADVPDF